MKLTSLAAGALGTLCALSASKPGQYGVGLDQELVHCRPFSSSTTMRLSLTTVQTRLPGDYAFTVVVTSAPKRDTIVDGYLSLRQTPARLVRLHSAKVVFPLTGWSDVDLTKGADVSLVYSPASRDTLRPGVQGILDTVD